MLPLSVMNKRRHSPNVCHSSDFTVFMLQLPIVPKKPPSLPPPTNLSNKKEKTMLTFLCYPKCTTCQKAMKFLDDHNIPYVFRDIKQDKPTFEELTEWISRSGLPLKRFFNTSGLLYKSLSLKEKLPTMSESEMLHLLATDGMLVKRPLLIGEDFVLVGFREEEYQGL